MSIHREQMSNAIAHAKKARTLYKQGNFREAIDNYERAIYLEPLLQKIYSADILLCRARLPRESKELIDNTEAESRATKEEEVIANSSKSTQIFYFPDYTSTNPYQLACYGQANDYLLTEPANIRTALKGVAKGGRIIFHLHWYEPIIYPAKDYDESMQKSRDFLSDVDEFICKGGTILWTLHNFQSHEGNHANTEQWLINELLKRDIICIYHTEESRKSFGKSFGCLPSKSIVAQHGSFAGYYKTTYSREMSRAILGIPNAAFVFGAIGQIRRYKGLDIAASALSKISQDYENIYLLIAGKPSTDCKNMLDEIIRTYSNIIVKPLFIDDNDLCLYINSIDVSLFTYERITTSGSIMLSVDFLVPFIAEKTHGTQDLFDKLGDNLSFANKSALDVAKAMQKAIELDPFEVEKARNRMKVFRKSNDWSNYSLLALNFLSNHEKADQIEARNGVKIVNKHKVVFARSRQLGICIVNYKCLADISDNLRCLANQTYKDFHVCIVDNGSDPEYTLIGEYDFPVTYLSLHENGGYALGVNTGVDFLRLIGCESILILNPDMKCDPSAIKELLMTYANSDYDILSPVICFCDNKREIWYGGGKIEYSKEIASADNLYYRMDKSAIVNDLVDTDFVSGAAFIARSSIFAKAGPMPTHYFLYFEEVQWSIDAQKRGLRLGVANVSGFNHAKKSSGRIPQPYYLYYYSRSYILFASRNTAIKLDQSLKILLNNFGKPWLEKIFKSEPCFYQYYKFIYDKACFDAKCLAFIPTERPPADTLRRYNLATKVHLESIKDVKVSYDFYFIKFTCRIEVEDFLAPFLITARVGDLSYNVNFPANEHSSASVKSLDNNQNYKISADIPILAFRDAFNPGDDFLWIEILLDQVPVDNFKINASMILHDLSQPAVARVNGINQDGFLSAWCVQLQANSKDLDVSIVINNKKLNMSFLLNSTRNDTASLLACRQDGIGILKNIYPLSVPKSDSLEVSILLSEQILHTKHIDMCNQMDERNKILDSKGSIEDWFYSNRQLPIIFEDDIKDFRDYLPVSNISSPGSFDSAKKARVSIIMPVFNRESIVGQAISSVLNQSYEDWELVCVDDCSSDGSGSILDYHANIDSRIRILRHSSNKGVSAARNTGLRVSSGQYIAFLDSDNVWHKDFLATMVHALSSNGDALSAYCGDYVSWSAGYFDDDAQPKNISAVRLGAFNRDKFFSKNFVDLNIIMHRRTEAIENMFREDMTRLVDWEYLLRLFALKEPLYVPRLLAIYRFDSADNQITFNEPFAFNKKVFDFSLATLRPKYFSAKWPLSSSSVF